MQSDCVLDTKYFGTSYNFQLDLGRFLLPRRSIRIGIFNWEGRIRARMDGGKLMSRSNHQSSGQAIHSKGDGVEMHNSILTKWSNYTVLQTMLNACDNELNIKSTIHSYICGWISLILLAPACKHSVDQTQPSSRVTFISMNSDGTTWSGILKKSTLGIYLRISMPSFVNIFQTSF